MEYELMMKLNKLETYIGGEGKFDEENYLFINTAYEPSLTNVETEYGEDGKIVVTDREKLGTFFELMNYFGNRHKYILCDIFFNIRTDNDSLISQNIAITKNIIIPAEYDPENHQLNKPVFDVKYAQADYITYEGIVSKIRLFADESKSKTLPLVMYEDCNNVNIRTASLGLFHNGSYIPRSIYPRYYFDREKMRKHEISLSKLLHLLMIKDTLFYNDVLKNKILILGNFSEDLHPSFIGPLPGSLILFNTFLTLEAGYHKLHWSWFLFALLSFTFLCYREFFKGEKEAAVEKTNLQKFLKNILSVAVWCLLISFVSGILFKVHITIILMIIYMELFRHIGKLKWLMVKKN
jgi:hypothetical protein